MQLIAVTDIFGRTRAFEEILENLSLSYDSVEVLDPYRGVEIDFRNEDEAYSIFQGRMGVEAYAKDLLRLLEGREKQRVTILGFSVGASAIWSISEQLKMFNNTRAILFYSSQLRHYLGVDPSIFIDVYFAKSEPHYDVEEVRAQLSKKAKVQCHTTPYSHGFMNRKSNNFNEQGYVQYLKHLTTVNGN